MCPRCAWGLSPECGNPARHGLAGEGCRRGFLIDPDPVRSHFQRFRAGGITALLHMNYVGSEAWLDTQQLQELDQHLRGTLYLTAAEVAGYVQARWGVCYTLSGMTALLHRLDYVYKKATLEPGKHPAPEVQQA